MNVKRATSSSVLLALLAVLPFSAGSVAGSSAPEMSTEAPLEVLAEMTVVPEAGLESCSEPIEQILPLDHPQPVAGMRLISFPGQHRMFGVIPNYRAAQVTGEYQPLSTRQKFDIARRDSFDWPNFFLLAGFAVQNQVAEGGFSHNGGLKGFAEFYSRSLADQVIGNYITEAILPGLLHEDPRFFRLGGGSIRHRAFHAVASIAVTRAPGGQARFNFSEIVGNMGVTAITQSYYDGKFGSEAIERYGMSLGNDAISNLLTEFWPDIKRHIMPHWLQ